jgi:hypothetical protein
VKLTVWRLAAASTVAAMIAGLALDQPVARAMRDLEASSLWDRVLEVVEYITGISPWKWTMPVLLGAGCAITLAVPRLRAQSHGWLYVTFVYLAAQNATLWLKTLMGAGGRASGSRSERRCSGTPAPASRFHPGT